MTAHLTGGESLRGRTGSPRKEIDMSDVSETADVIIVGGGSAGAGLAPRHSQDPERTVLLLEAGAAYDPGAYPPALLDADRIADPAHDWGYTSHGSGQSRIPTPRGKVVGGSSAVNAADRKSTR